MGNDIKVRVEPVDYCFINKYDPSVSLSCIVHLCFESENGISYGWGANEQSLANTRYLFEHETISEQKYKKMTERIAAWNKTSPSCV